VIGVDGRMGRLALKFEEGGQLHWCTFHKVLSRLARITLGRQARKQRAYFGAVSEYSVGTGFEVQLT